MNIFEQFAMGNEETNNKVEVAAVEEVVEETVEEEDVEDTIDDEIDESINLVDDGKGNFMMDIPRDPEVIAEENKAKEVAKENEKKKTDKKKKDKLEVKSLNKDNSKKNANELIEKKFTEYSKIIVKVFSEKLYEYDNADEIKMLKLEDITNNLVTEHDYEEFVNGVNWNLTPSADKTIGYLIPTYKFQPKG